MSCIFCGYNNHVSQNCNIYFSDEERRGIVYAAKNRCYNCLTVFNKNVNYLLNDNSNCEDQKLVVTVCAANYSDRGFQNCRNCLSNEKCFICFSTDHHTVFCPDRLKVLTMFPPNIDIDLMPRFLELLTNEEKYLLCLSSPNNFTYTKIKPFKVDYRKEAFTSDFKNASKCDYFVADIAYIVNDSQRYIYHCSIPRNLVLSILKQMSYRIQHLEIHRTSVLSVELLQLLSLRTTILKCLKVEFVGKLTFSKILKTAPYLEEIDIHQTNVKVDNSWAGYLLKLNRATKMKNVHLKIGADYNFNVGILATLMKKKSASISLWIILPWYKHFDNEITTKLSSHFVPYVFSFITLTIYIVDKNFNVMDTKKLELKNV